MMGKILSILADDKTRMLIDHIYSSNLQLSDTEDVNNSLHITKYGISRRQYYERINLLIDTGIIIKLKGVGRYRLTALGQILYHYLNLFKTPFLESNLWKIKVVDSIIFGNNSMKKEDVENLINALIDNPEIRQILKNTTRKTEYAHNYKVVRNENMPTNSILA